MGLVVGLAALALGLVPDGLAAARSGARLTVSPRSGLAGRLVTVRGYGFRPHARGIVLFGAKSVASFRAGGSGMFRAKFVVPPSASRRLRVVAEQTLRKRRGSVRVLRRAAASFQVLALDAFGKVVANGSGGLSAAPNSPTSGSGGSGGGTAGGWWIPPRALTWYWQLQGGVNNNEPVAAYDIDGVDNSAGEVATLHGQGKHVICYIDAGTYEPGRPDSSSFPASVLGSGVEGWPGERWLDIANLSVLQPIMTARFQKCKEKGFDAVEPDNMDGYENASGFPLTAAQQLTYDEWVAAEVHSLGMAVLQKNDGGQTAELQPHFDGALNEQCNQYSECGNFQAYLSVGKPVLNAEYGSSNAFCAADSAAGIMGARYGLSLDGSTFEPCW
jgi:Glycoside-hydrolase family GH114